MYGGDLDIIKGTDVRACEDACRANASCIGYSYDRWNNACYTKKAVNELLADARSTTMIRSDLPRPPTSATPWRFENFRNRAYVREAGHQRADGTFLRGTPGALEQLQAKLRRVLKRPQHRIHTSPSTAERLMPVRLNNRSSTWEMEVTDARPCRREIHRGTP